MAVGEWDLKVSLSCLFGKKTADLFWEGVCLISQTSLDHRRRWRSAPWWLGQGPAVRSRSLPCQPPLQTKVRGRSPGCGWDSGSDPEGRSGRGVDRGVTTAEDESRRNLPGLVVCRLVLISGGRSPAVSSRWMRPRAPRERRWALLERAGLQGQADLRSGSDFFSHWFRELQQITLSWYFSYLTQGVRLIDFF